MEYKLPYSPHVFSFLAKGKIMPFLREICEDVIVTKKGDIVPCKAKATHLFDDNEFIHLCEKHYKEWIKKRDQISSSERR